MSSQVFDIESIVIHPNFDSKIGFFNDIALISLKSPINLLNQKGLPINSVCLPNKNQIVSKKLTVSGWGLTSEDGLSAYNLRAVDIPLDSARLDNAPCLLYSILICAVSVRKPITQILVLTRNK